MVTALNIIYEPSDSIIAQGKDVSRQEKRGYYSHQGGCGTYRMNKPSTVILKFKVNGKTHSCFVKDLIREVYGISRVGKKQADRFFNDVMSGIITLDYSEENGLSVIN